MLSDIKTNRAFCFGSHALRGIGGLFMGRVCQNLICQDLAGRAELFVNFGPAQFLRYQPLERA